ncbi:MAG TPA: hypothetical protein VGK35_02145 [Actinotalea sp.]|jgi:hypothetical protein
MSWKTRTATAGAAAALLTGGGVVALANAEPQVPAAVSPATPVVAAPTGVDAAEAARLEGALRDLLTQVDGLRSTLASLPAPSAALGAGDGSSPVVTGDDSTSGFGAGSASDDSVTQDAGDDHGDDGAEESDDHGDDGSSSERDGEDHPEEPSDG